MLKFRVQKEGEENYLVRSHSSYLMSRSVNAEITLHPGRYHVLMKITAYRQRDVVSTEEVVSRLAPTRREKLVQIGLSHDLAHAKGLAVESREERKEREAREERHKIAERQRLRHETKLRLQKEWIRERKLEARQQRVEARHLAKQKAYAMQVNGLSEQSTNGGTVQSPTDYQDIGLGINGSVPTIQFNGIHASKYPNGDNISSLPSLDPRHSTDSLGSSDLDLLDGFEFDSDLDMPPEEPVSKPTPHPPSAASPEAVNNDPWNAVCVVGMRVYSKDPQLSLQVVRPVPEDKMEASLDIDDPAVSATSEKHHWRRTSI